MNEEEIDKLDRFAHILSKELKPVEEALQRAIENLNSQGIEARVYFNAEDGVLSAFFYPRDEEWQEVYVETG